MRSLASLLEGAVRRAAFEVRIESGQPVLYTTARGTEAEASVLPRPELFDMIVAAVDDSQQVELAVGNPVEFELDAGAKWSVSAEPGHDGITVRAKRPGRPTAPALHDDVSPGGLELELEEPDFDVGRGGSSAAPAQRRPRSPSEAPPSQLHVEALDVPMVDDSISAEFAGVSTGPAPPFESGTWTLDDDDDLDIGLDDEPDEDSLPTGFASVGAADRHIGVPADDDDQADDSFAARSARRASTHALAHGQGHGSLAGRAPGSGRGRGPERSVAPSHRGSQAAREGSARVTLE
jgi:hypothetical protein